MNTRVQLRRGTSSQDIMGMAGQDTRHLPIIIITVFKCCKEGGEATQEIDEHVTI